MTGVREKGRHEGNFELGIESGGEKRPVTAGLDAVGARVLDARGVVPEAAVQSAIVPRARTTAEGSPSSAIVRHGRTATEASVEGESSAAGTAGRAGRSLEEARYPDDTQLLVLAVLLDSPTNKPNPDIEGPRGLTPLQARQATGVRAWLNVCVDARRRLRPRGE